MKKRILIADDEAALLSTMAFTLKRKGYDTISFNNGQSAFKAIINLFLENKFYDLIITDIQMPVLSGMELIKQIRETGIDTPVLAISGFGNKKLIAELKNIGCSDYLDKPFHMNEFIYHVSNLLKINEAKNRKIRLRESTQPEQGEAK